MAVCGEENNTQKEWGLPYSEEKLLYRVSRRLPIPPINTGERLQKTDSTVTDKTTESKKQNFSLGRGCATQETQQILRN